MPARRRCRPRSFWSRTCAAGCSAAGFLLFMPVYSSPTLPETAAERRETLRGFVYSPFRAEDFFRTALAASASNAFVEVFDGDSPSTDTLLYRTGSSVPPDSLTDTRHLPLAGHEWTLRVSAPATTLSMASSPIPWIVLGGVSTTLLLAGLAQALALSRQRLQERIRADLALAERERQAAQVLENALDAYVAIDAGDRIVEWNRQAATLFGWSAHEAIGRRLTDTIIPPDLRERHLAALSTFATRAEHALLGKRLEMPARCRDGSEIFVELSIVQIAAADRAALRRLTARHHTGAPAGGRDPPAERDTGAARRRAHGAARSREPRAVDGESRPGGIRVQRLARSARAAACDRRARHAVSRSGRSARPTRSAITRERSVATSRTWASSSTTCSTSR